MERLRSKGVIMLHYFDQKKARQLEQQNKWAQAHDAYKALAKEASNTPPELAYRIGFTAVKSDQPEAAIPWLLQATEKKPEQHSWCKYLGQVALRVKNTEAAIAAFERGGLEALADAKWFYAVGQLLEQQENYQQAARFYQAAARLEPGKARYDYRHGRVLQQAECYPAAIEAYQRALTIDPDNIDALVSLGRSSIEAGNEDLTTEAYQRLVQLNNNQAVKFHHVAYYELAQQKTRSNEHEAALPLYQKAIEIQPKYAVAWHAQAHSQQELGDAVAALESLKQAVALRPDNTEWHIELAQLCSQSGPFAVAAQAWAKALKAEPDNQQWLFQHALMLDMAGKVKEAQKVYLQLLELQTAETEAGAEQQPAGHAELPDQIEQPEQPEQAHPLALYCEGLRLSQSKQHADAQEPFTLAIELLGEETPAHWHYRLGTALSRGQRAADSEAPLHQAISLLPQNQYYVYALAEAIRRQGRTWQEVDTLQEALRVLRAPANPNPNPTIEAQWQYELADAQDKMNRFTDAGAAFAMANSLKPGNAQWHFREGYAWDRANKPIQAQSAYSAAIAADKNLKAKEFGIGVFHQQRGFWPQAAEAYEKQAKADPFNAELQYRLGLAHDRCYHWAQAEQCYQQALVFEPHKPDWYYRLGFVLERQDKLEQAAQMYEYAAVTRASHTPYWFYRLGYVLQRAGKYQQACSAFLQTNIKPELEALPIAQAKRLRPDMSEQELETFVKGFKQLEQSNQQKLRKLLEQNTALHSTDPAQAYFQLGQQAERHGMWQEAAQAYRQAVARSNNHNTLWYYRLGYVLVQLGLFEQASEAFVNSRIFQRPDGIDMSRYAKDAGLMQVLEYTEFLETLPVAPKTVVYESYAGNTISCNSYAMFLAVVDDPGFADWQHVIVLNDLENVPDTCRGRSNVVFVMRDSQLYCRYIATAGWLVNNSTFPSYFVRRPEQKYLNTWHGTPLKTLGTEMRGRFLEHKNGARNFLQATHLLSPNSHTSKVMLESFDVSHLYDGLFLESGYPRADLTLAATDKQKAKIIQQLRLDTSKPVILYAPTWRGTHGEINFDTSRLEADLAALDAAGHQVLFRGHSLAESVIREEAPYIKLVDSNIDTNLLLSVVDVLITDYSSVFFEYISLQKPIIYYAYDQDEYLAERGMYFGLETMPGKVCTNQDELLDALKEPDSWMQQAEILQKYQAAIDMFCRCDDGKATKRAVDWFFRGAALPDFENSLASKQATEAVLMFCGPFMGNGITSAAINLCRLADNNGLPVTLVVDPYGIEGFPDREERFAQLDGIVETLGRVGRLAYSAEEKWIHDQYMGGKIEKEAVQAQLDGLYRREYKRCFGSAQVKASINFEGYTRFWVELMARADKQSRKVIYQHNDMYGEYTMKLPYLKGVFNAYDYYDAIVSVSPMMREVNAEKLSKQFNIDVDKFTAAVNPLDTWTLEQKAQEPLDEDIEQWLAQSRGTLFLNIGRLSPEKRHDKLISAFDMYRDSGNEGRLIIAGTGPLVQNIEDQVSCSPYREDIFLAGHRMNPYPLFKKADCFVLSSDHEGQPITLLESLQLGLPAIATDIPSNRYVLDGGLGVLAVNNLESLAAAMQGASTKNKSMVMDFNINTYQQRALNDFKRLLVEV